MIYIIIILTLIIIILSTYLFLFRKELNKIPLKIDCLKKNKSNNLLYSEHNIKVINKLLFKINDLLKESTEIKLFYENKNKSLNKMITNISHDLRTPLTSAIGYMDIVLNSNISEEEKIKELKIIEERLRKLETLINSFFEFSKIISNDERVKLEKINIITVLENSIVGFYNDFKKQNRQIKLDNNLNNIKLYSDSMLLTRVFDNLIINAYTHSNSDLNIKVIKDEQIKIIFINDLITKDLDTLKMFEEFYTTDISRTKGNTGLGLAIAKEFVEKLNGSISAIKKNNKLYITVKF